MPATAPRDSVIATVGDGFGSLLVHTTARYLGFENDQLSVFGPSDNPVGTYQQFAYNLGQTVLRSESESHFLAPDWPTFAQLDAWSHKSLKPLWRTTRRKYNPGVPEILTEAAVVTRRTRMGSGAGSGAGRMAPAADAADAALRDVRRAGELHRPRQARDAGSGPRPAVVPAGARQGAQGPGAGRPDRAGVRAQAVRAGRPLHRARRGHRLGQRVGEHHRRRRVGAGADAERAARDPGPERSPLPVRVDRDRRVHAAAVRPADRVPRPGPARHAARAQAVARRGSRPASRRDGSTRSSARSTRSSRDAPACGCTSRAGSGEDPGLARRHRRHRRHRVQQVGADASADPPAGRVLQGAGGRRAGSGCRRTAASPDSTCPSHGCAAWG